VKQHLGLAGWVLFVVIFALGAVSQIMAIELAASILDFCILDLPANQQHLAAFRIHAGLPRRHADSSFALGAEIATFCES